MALPGLGVVQVPTLNEGHTQVAEKPIVTQNGWLRMRTAFHLGEWLFPERSQGEPSPHGTSVATQGKPLPSYFLQTWFSTAEPCVLVIDKYPRDCISTPLNSPQIIRSGWHGPVLASQWNKGCHFEEWDELWVEETIWKTRVQLLGLVRRLGWGWQAYSGNKAVCLWCLAQSWKCIFCNLFRCWGVKEMWLLLMSGT